MVFGKLEKIESCQELNILGRILSESWTQNNLNAYDWYFPFLAKVVFLKAIIMYIS